MIIILIFLFTMLALGFSAVAGTCWYDDNARHKVMWCVVVCLSVVIGLVILINAYVPPIAIKFSESVPVKVIQTQQGNAYMIDTHSYSTSDVEVVYEDVDSPRLDVYREEIESRFLRIIFYKGALSTNKYHVVDKLVLPKE